MTAATEDTNNFFLEVDRFNEEKEEDAEEALRFSNEELRLEEDEEEDLGARRSPESMSREGVEDGNCERMPEDED